VVTPNKLLVREHGAALERIALENAAPMASVETSRGLGQALT
jgi:hypothetical protein